MTSQQLQGAEKAFQVLNFWKVDAAEFVEFYKARVKETTDYENFIKAEHAKLNKVKEVEVKTEPVQAKTETKVETKTKTK